MDELTLRVNQNPGTIELNFDELNEQMDKILAEYKGAVFTDESMDIAKAERASLRKLKKDVDHARIAAKKEWMKPLDDFESQMKKLSAKVDKPINLIDGQIKDYEAKRREEKKKAITAVYEELVGNMREYLPLSRIYDPKWENVSTTMKFIRESITESVENAAGAVRTISEMQSDAAEEALKIYKNTLDITKAVAYINNYERQKAEIMRREEERRRQEEERRRNAEIERARAAERQAIERESKIKEETKKAAAGELRKELEKKKESGVEDEALTPFTDDELPFETPETVTVFYKIVATSEELETVDTMLNSLGIFFERRNA
jgi:hypothetical protein